MPVPIVFNNFLGDNLLFFRSHYRIAHVTINQWNSVILKIDQKYHKLLKFSKNSQKFFNNLQIRSESVQENLQLLKTLLEERIPTIN